MKNIIEKNGISIKDFIEGKREPEVFKNKEFTKLHLSTLRKVQAMADLLDLVIARKLKTNSKWYERSGLTVQGVYEYVREKWWFALLSFFVGTIFGIFIEQILQ